MCGCNCERADSPHDSCRAQVTAEALAATVQELQGKLAAAGSTMQERQEKLAALQQRLAEEASTLSATNAQVRDKRKPKLLGILSACFGARSFGGMCENSW